MDAPEKLAPQAKAFGGRLHLRQLLRWIERLLAVTGLCFVLWQFGFELLVMTSNSMSPTLRGSSFENGDRVVVEKITPWFRAPRRWEIYFFFDAEGTPVAKRIVGLPGEQISIKNNWVWINGKELPRPVQLPSQKYFPYGNLAGGREFDCGDGYFVLGDDSGDSYDSRFLGPVKGDKFRGRVWCILWPKSHFGLVR